MPINLQHHLGQNREKTKITFNNYSPDAELYPVKFKIYTLGSKTSDLSLNFNGTPSSHTVSNEGTIINLQYYLKPGLNTLTIQSDSPGIDVPQKHRRDYLKITDFNYGQEVPGLK